MVAAGMGFQFAWMLDDSIKTIKEIDLAAEQPRFVSFSESMQELENIVLAHADKPTDLPVRPSEGWVKFPGFLTLSAGRTYETSSKTMEKVSEANLKDWIGHSKCIGSLLIFDYGKFLLIDSFYHYIPYKIMCRSDRDEKISTLRGEALVQKNSLHLFFCFVQCARYLDC